MTEETKVERKLAAILQADVVGYSRLMGEDEVGTHRAVIASLDAITELIESHGGSVVKFAGDALLAEFPSAVNAVECAVNVQRDLATRAESRPSGPELSYRIGVNLGDIIVAREDIFGDGVNVAARLEGLAEPGGICISGTVFDQVRNKLDVGYAYLGEQKIKNIAEPVRAYQVIVDPAVAGEVRGETAVAGSGSRSLSAALTVATIVAAGGIAFWYGYLRPQPDTPEVASGTAESQKLPAKPSIAVLPFKNISGDEKQDYFSDGITEDIITDLSKFRGLFVIASNTAFTYKGKPTKIQDVSRDLGVRYILEGSVQRAENKVRVNAQLIDGKTGHNLWAERLIRGSQELFALQDELVRTIVAKLAVKVDAAEQTRAARKGTKNLEAYDYVLRGRELRARTSRSANAEAKDMIRRAIELDPGYAPGHVALGWCYIDALRFGWTGSPTKTLQKAHDLAQKALSLDEENASAHRLLGTTYYKRLNYDLAIAEFERALELNPNDADTLDGLGAVRLYDGKPDAAIEAVETAMRFNPNLGPSGLIHLGLAYYLKGQYDDAIATLQRALSRNPKLVILHVGLAASYAKADRSEEAGQAAANVRRLFPFFQVDGFGNAFRNAAHRTSIREGLRLAGLD